MVKLEFKSLQIDENTSNYKKVEFCKKEKTANRTRAQSTYFRPNECDK